MKYHTQLVSRHRWPVVGEYTGEFQLWPGVKTWIMWAHEHVDVIWLTSWESDTIRPLSHVLYYERFRCHPDIPPFRHGTRSKRYSEFH